MSRQEIESRCNSRMFSLQKLVEVAYFNMNQIRIVWTRIWHHMAEHFETVSSLCCCVDVDGCLGGSPTISKQFVLVVVLYPSHLHTSAQSHR